MPGTSGTDSQSPTGSPERRVAPPTASRRTDENLSLRHLGHPRARFAEEPSVSSLGLGPPSTESRAALLGGAPDIDISQRRRPSTSSVPAVSLLRLPLLGYRLLFSAAPVPASVEFRGDSKPLRRLGGVRLGADAARRCSPTESQFLEPRVLTSRFCMFSDTISHPFPTSLVNDIELYRIPTFVSNSRTKPALEPERKPLV